MWIEWQNRAPKIYDSIYYDGNPLVSKINLAGHKLLEKKFNDNIFFEKVIEVGAGTGAHLDFVKHTYNSYYVTDLSEDLLKLGIKKNIDSPKIIFKKEDATNLSFPDSTFDRLISVYNLEHLLQPHLVLKEWMRVVKLNGVISIAIPLDGGLAWRLGRFLTTRNSFKKNNLNLDYIIAREHINPSYNLISLIQYYFQSYSESWYPLRIPLVDINLVYVCNLINTKNESFTAKF